MSVAAVRTTQAWLQSSWSVQVPFAWLEACVQWLLEEAGGAGYLSQQQINQQALDQWLLTDLRDLDYPVLPEGLAQAQKTKLSGTFCVQVDSLLDISQPAYGQLQKWRGTDCANDEVSAVTQATQRPWEAKSTRMLLMQVTDGVQSLEAMEYQPIPALSTALRPGAKLQLQGQIVCRLGVLLLGPSNIKVLGGEVEDLVDRNDQVALFVFFFLVLTRFYQSMFVFDSPIQSYRSGSTQSGRGSSVQSHYHRNDTGLSDHMMQDHNMTDEDFPNEDFDDLPLDELDSVIFQESTNAVTQSDRPSRNRESSSNKVVISGSTYRQSYTSDTSEFDHQSAKKNLQSGCTVPAVTLTSPPFTYLCLLEGLMSKPQSHTTEIHVKAFIVTLLGKLSSTNGVWRVCATISDGTGYLDVELSDEVLTGLLGFSVAEKGALKRDPARKGVLDAGMRRCQEELVDMCCVMTIVIEPQGRKAVVTKADPVTEKVLQELEQRVRERKK
uniref:RecQ-mediated genome instability protein 1 n=1 Tax=Mastacembelus armatus TaxID=205130 RepID=A0A3Q3KNL6_9TELE